MTPEGRVKTQVKDWLNAHGVWHFSPVSNGMGRHGIPDLICCYQGRFLGIECKAPGKRHTVTPLQQRELRKIDAAGGIALVVDDASQLPHLLGDLIRAGQ
jgi:hypothetical protein